MRCASILFPIAMAAVFLCSTPQAHAEAWGTNAASAILKEVLERTQRVIDGVILSSTKTAATTVLNAQVASLIGGSNLGESRIITDWEKYLYQDPMEKTGVYMDSYLTAVTGGRATSNYVSAGGSSYNSELRSYAEGMLVSTSNGQVIAANAEEQIPNFKEEMAKGNIMAYNVYFQGSNNPFIVTMNARAQEQAIYESIQKTQEAKAVAYGGYRGTETADGKITTPGSTVRDVVANVYGIGPSIIATSSNPSELTSGVVLAVVNQTMSGLFERGLGTVRSNIEREVSSVSTQVGNQVQGLTRSSGTLSQFSTSARQQSDVSLNSAADATRSIPVEIGGYR